MLLLALLLTIGVNSEAQQKKKDKKSTTKLTRQYVDYVKNKNKGKEKLAEKKTSDPATVTRDSARKDKPKTYEDIFNEFSQKAKSDYENFRDKANRDYADFIRKAWKEYGAEPAIPKPKDEEMPPVTYPVKDEEELVEDKPLPIKLKSVMLPAPTIPQPVPVAPIKEIPKPVVQQEQAIPFSLYGTDFKVRFNKEELFTLPSCDKDAIADAWLRLSGDAYNNTIRDCLEIRIRQQLSDWAYMKLLKQMAEACLGRSNEATLLMAYVFCQSGYQMRLGIADDHLYMLYASRHTIYDHSYFRIGDVKYYPLDCTELQMSICEVGFPKEQALSLIVAKEQLFAEDYSEMRTLKCNRFDIDTRVNKNLIAFYDDYPSSMVGDNIMTRWAMYANVPSSPAVRDVLLPALREKVRGLSQKAAMENLLYFTQFAFIYKRDDDVWGHDRAFFPEETLFYPYCDCEDRSIFLSRVVRDLLGLKCILIFYPGHLAMAVHFTEDVKGDYIMLDGEKYVVCDPTYIGAPVGATMPGMDNQSAQVILLE